MYFQVHSPRPRTMPFAFPSMPPMPEMDMDLGVGSGGSQLLPQMAGMQSADDMMAKMQAQMQAQMQSMMGGSMAGQFTPLNQTLVNIAYSSCKSLHNSLSYDEC